MIFAPLEGWRRVEVTDHHAAFDYAKVLKNWLDMAESEFDNTPCRMMSGGNWWRTNEISIGHLPTKETLATVGVTKLSRVHMLIRGECLAASMSRYLIDRIAATPSVELRPSTDVPIRKPLSNSAVR
jgi:hypothetical protein